MIGGGGADAVVLPTFRGVGQDQERFQDQRRRRRRRGNADFLEVFEIPLRPLTGFSDTKPAWFVVVPVETLSSSVNSCRTEGNHTGKMVELYLTICAIWRV